MFPSRGDVTPISVMNEMNNIMEYMVSFNPFLNDLQAKYNGLESKKNETMETSEFYERSGHEG